MKKSNDAHYYASRHDSVQAGVRMMEIRRSPFVLSFVSYDDITANFGDQLIDRRVVQAKGTPYELEISFNEAAIISSKKD